MQRALDDMEMEQLTKDVTQVETTKMNGVERMMTPDYIKRPIATVNPYARNNDNGVLHLRVEQHTKLDKAITLKKVTRPHIHRYMLCLQVIKTKIRG